MIGSNVRDIEILTLTTSVGTTSLGWMLSETAVYTGSSIPALLPLIGAVWVSLRMRGRGGSDTERDARFDADVYDGGSR